MIGVLVADFEPFSTEVLKGAADAIRGTGFELVVYSAGGRVDEHVGWERRYLSRLSGTLIDGAVLVTPTVTDVSYGAPIVAVDPHTGPSELPTVDSDNLQRRPPRRRPPARARAPPDRHDHRPPRPAVRAAARAGLPRRADRGRDAGRRGPASSSARSTPSSRPRRRPRRCCTLPDRPTAIFAANDLSAITTMEVAAELGLRRARTTCRWSASTTSPSRRSRTPPLTTVEQPIRQMGQRAMELLVRLIAASRWRPTTSGWPPGSCDADPPALSVHTGS